MERILQRQKSKSCDKICREGQERWDTFCILTPLWKQWWYVVFNGYSKHRPSYQIIHISLHSSYLGRKRAREWMHACQWIPTCVENSRVREALTHKEYSRIRPNVLRTDIRFFLYGPKRRIWCLWSYVLNCTWKLKFFLYEKFYFIYKNHLQDNELF